MPMDLITLVGERKIENRAKYSDLSASDKVEEGLNRAMAMRTVSITNVRSP